MNRAEMFFSHEKQVEGEIQIRDSDGRTVPMDINRLCQECEDSGASRWVAAEVGIELLHRTRDGLKLFELRELMYDILKRKDPDVAARYRNFLDLKVRTSNLLIQPFDRKKIEESLLTETEIVQERAEQVAYEVEKDIRRLSPHFISAPLLRELVNAKLIEMGLDKVRKSYTRVGLPVYEVTKYLDVHDRENANLLFNPETIHKRFGDSVSKEYALVHILPTYLSDAHMSGVIHIHDLDYFATRPFCQSHDLRYFFRHGLMVDGSGNHTSIAGPAKHPEVAVLHAAKILAAAQTNWAGGQGLSFFTVFLAPYLEGLPYTKIKQLMQMFIYEMSQMYVARGGQTVFSSVELEPGVPRHIADFPAMKGGKTMGVYGDYEDTVNLAFNAYLDVMLQGDNVGKPFEFPKPEVVLRPYWLSEYEEEYRKASLLSAKFGSTYFLNLIPPYMGETACSQCCRVILKPNENEMADLHEGTLRLGSLQVVTVNLPRIAYDADGSDDKLFELLRERMELTVDVFKTKREVLQRRLDSGALPFGSQEVRKGESYLNIDNQSLPIGFVGLNEMLKAHTDQELHESNDAWRFGLKTVDFMNKVRQDLCDRYGWRFALLQTPAESCAHRLAKLDKAEYNGRAVVQGDPLTNSFYYSNSSHVRVSADIPLWQRIKIDSSFHPLTAGGAILHVWMGEANPNPEALHKLTYKLANNTLSAYWAHTKDITSCKKCNTVLGGIATSCPNCNATGDDIEYYSRITGYYQKISGWNAGKLSEWRDRKRYAI